MSIKHLSLLGLAFVACTATSTSTAPPATTNTQPVESTTTTLAPVDFTAPIEMADLTGRIVVADTVAYVTDPAGTNRQEVPDAMGTSQPTWSPDGSTIAFAALADGLPAIGLVEPGEPAQFIEAPFLPFYYHWSPDGSHLAFLGNGPSGLVELGFADISDQTAIRADRGTPYYFDWSPAGDEVFSHAGTADTRLVSIDGSVTDIADNAGVYQAPQWTDGGVLQLITVPATISARGMRIVLQSTDQVLVIGPPGAADPVRVATVEALATFDSNGTDVVYTDTTNPTTVVRGPLMLARPDADPTTISEGPVIAYEWSPDGHRLLFLEVVSGSTAPQARWVVWERGETVTFEPFTPSPTSVSTYFPFWDQYARSLTLWEPGGRAFVYSALDSDTGSSEVFVQPVQDGVTPMMIGMGDWASWSS